MAPAYRGAMGKALARGLVIFVVVAGASAGLALVWHWYSARDRLAVDKEAMAVGAALHAATGIAPEIVASITGSDETRSVDVRVIYPVVPARFDAGGLQQLTETEVRRYMRGVTGVHVVAPGEPREP